MADTMDEEYELPAGADEEDVCLLGRPSPPACDLHVTRTPRRRVANLLLRPLVEGQGAATTWFTDPGATFDADISVANRPQGPNSDIDARLDALPPTVRDAARRMLGAISTPFPVDQETYFEDKKGLDDLPD